jgi:DNA-binding transcriptional MerR regulator
MGVLIRTGDLARALEIMPTKVTLYAKLGLFKTKGQTEGGRHLFDLDENKRRYETILKLKEKRLTLDEIAKQLK